MSRIATRFVALQERSRKALIPYITAGDPHLDVTLALMHDMVKAGADLLELGVPFSDPMADGPVIQQACERALKHGVSLRDVLGLVRRFRRDDQDTPVVLMGYLNPIEAIGYETLAKEASEAGVDGLLTVDLPPEESREFLAALRPYAIDPIFLLAPNSEAARTQRICELASGFVYYVSLKGVTGSKSLDIPAVAEKLQQIRQHTRLPLGVGFGIRDAQTAAAVAQVADAVIVGSTLVSILAEHGSQPELARHKVSELLAQMRQAIDQST
ncbi:tryptophan synthase subunit alpha [Thiorhodospira sibirica]|uniref:tryptophan synthase subunit alpha n=1 Tax=Thiorhodospira sibirica TaxID=154347 RepID=UPI00022C5E56|nr:tryptophan synthase subunit alpha [Thiorhodospira sibirica]